MTEYAPLPKLPLDIEIAQQAEIRNIQEVASRGGINDQELYPCGSFMAKVENATYSRVKDHPQGKLILVTGMTPTAAGEGKTVTTIGLGQAMQHLRKNAMICIREPSLGPTFGMKGGAAGGGFSQVIPMEDINLHFTGDFHAVTTAHNLLAAVVDNHIYHGNELGIETVTWRRVLDLCDRQLRHCETGLGGEHNGVPRHTGFDITASSEIMAILALAKDLGDLQERLGRIVVARDKEGKWLYAEAFHCVPALAVLLRHAMKPNLVQTLEGTPVLIHAGPFGNIAHGCSSLRATKLAMQLSDYVVTEAGFAADLGAEKFFHIKCRQGGLEPSLVVLVLSCRALKIHGGVEDFNQENLEALEKGFANAQVHLENLKKFGLPVVVAINRFAQDSAAELDRVRAWCGEKEIPCAVSEVMALGGAGGVELAQAVVDHMPAKPPELQYLYPLKTTLKEKIETLAKEVYRAEGVHYSERAQAALDSLEAEGFGHLPICTAKTQYSISDNATMLGAPSGYTLEVRDVMLRNGAGFVVVVTGKMLLMPGMPLHPNVEKIALNAKGQVEGLS